MSSRSAIVVSVTRAHSAARWAAVGLTGAAVAWVLLIVVTPLAVAGGAHAWPAIVYEAAGLICHQRPERSFSLAGIQMPVCARCFGLYVSGAAGALVAWIAGTATLARSVTSEPRVPLIVAAVPTAVTVGLEWVGLAHPSGMTRAIAALPLGLAAGFLFVRLLADGGASGRPDQMRYHA